MVQGAGSDLLDREVVMVCFRTPKMVIAMVNSGKTHRCRRNVGAVAHLVGAWGSAHRPCVAVGLEVEGEESMVLFIDGVLLLWAGVQGAWWPGL